MSEVPLYLGQEAGGREREGTWLEGARRVQREERYSHAKGGPAGLRWRLRVDTVYCQSPLGPVDPSFRALSRRLKFTVRRYKFNKDTLSLRVEG